MFQLIHHLKDDNVVQSQNHQKLPRDGYEECRGVQAGRQVGVGVAIMS